MSDIRVTQSNVLVVGVSGAMVGASTRRTLQVALDGAAAHGARTEIMDLSTLRLPFAGSSWTAEEYPDVALFNDAMRRADALIWATPEYHGSFTGALKNALDLGSFEEYEGKMIALVGVAGGSMGALGALGHLRSVARQLHAWVLPQQVSVASSGSAFTPEGSLVDESLQGRLLKMGQEVARYARLHAVGVEPPLP